MGLFDKIFGSNKSGLSVDTTFAFSSDLMPEDQFWFIVETSYKKAEGEFNLQQIKLKDVLRGLSPHTIIMFDNRFKQLRGAVYNWQLWGAIYIINGGCSDDTFMDFRDWLIAQGKDFYYNISNNPALLENVDAAVIDVDWEGMGYVATDVFEDLTGEEDFPSDYVENHEISGEAWNEDSDDLKKMFPQLWAKYYNTYN